MATKRPTAVPRTFDDQLATFVARAKSEGWDKKNGIDIKTLETDLKAQRDSKQQDQELESAYSKSHRSFLEDQSARYHRFMTALGVVRVAYRAQPEMVDSLATFKRPIGTPRAKKVMTPAAAPTP